MSSQTEQVGKDLNSSGYQNVVDLMCGTEKEKRKGKVYE